MADTTDLTRAESHFEFGKNWASYAESISDVEIREAVHSLENLVGGRLDGKRFLDIGCGSGLHSLAALRLGAVSVMGVDLDDDSVNTTRKVLARYAPDREWTVQSASVFDMTVSHWGLFDVAYSWGVLHHTGDMYRAIRQAAALVRPAGWFVFALYRKTWMCWFWRWEKRWYTNASARARSIANGVYTRLFALGLLLTGRRFKEYVQTYNATRGMDYYHDVHDWLGGYPYESISVQEVDTLMRELGFERRRMLARQGRFLGRDFGLFGSGCDEFVYVRVA